MGHYYFSHGRYEPARTLYEYASSQDPQDADLWHALGAILLSESKFLKAQRLWQKAATEQEACRNHAGIQLQLKKMEAYGYFQSSCSTPTTPSPTHRWSSPAPQAFVTPHLIDPALCPQIIQWAETGTWTQQRHYAVPTHDVPVHTVPSLLEWFHDFMTHTMRPILAEQFHSSSHYFVHDAFCVKYQADQASNHLPIHIDESTHSLVLALNDDYEGGGTYFYDSDQTVRLATGDVLSFKGDELWHGGQALTRGTRYIIAVFLYHDDDDESEKEQSKASRPCQAPNTVGEAMRQAKKQKQEFSFGFQFAA